MSAALQLPMVLGSGCTHQVARESRCEWEERVAPQTAADLLEQSGGEARVSLAFYRKHTEKLLRRYLYASIQVGRAPSVLSNPVARGWASSRTVRTFEDALIFVLDVERCLDAMSPLDRQLLSRIVLQEYTQAEAAGILGMAVRTVHYKFAQALDRLTERLLASRLLLLPE